MCKSGKEMLAIPIKCGDGGHWKCTSDASMNRLSASNRLISIAGMEKLLASFMA